MLIGRGRLGKAPHGSPGDRRSIEQDTQSYQAVIRCLVGNVTRLRMSSFGKAPITLSPSFPSSSIRRESRDNASTMNKSSSAYLLCSCRKNWIELDQPCKARALQGGLRHRRDHAPNTFRIPHPRAHVFFFVFLLFSRSPCFPDIVSRRSRTSSSSISFGKPRPLPLATLFPRFLSQPSYIPPRI